MAMLLPLSGDPTEIDDFSARLGVLSKREREVAIGILRGLTTREMAIELRISPRTVEVHRARVLQKLNVRNTGNFFRLSALAYIRELGASNESAERPPDEGSLPSRAIGRSSSGRKRGG